MSTEIQSFELKAKTLDEAMQYAKLIANSDLAPKDFKGKPENVLIAIQMGHEVGLKPMQAIQNIAVINGRPCIWGDAAIAIVRSHPSCQSISEYYEGEGDNRTAVCIVKRAGQSEHKKEFSVADAKKAGLWGKSGCWQQYPDRMLQMRARGYAIRDTFADALKGFSIAEEYVDISKDDYVVLEQKKDVKQNLLEKIKEKNNFNIELVKIDFIKCQSLDELKEKYDFYLKEVKTPDDKKLLVTLKDNRKSELQSKTGEIDNKEWLEEFDGK